MSAVGSGTVRVGIVGVGLAGTLLAWRLCRPERVHVELFAGDLTADATSASGGLVRAFATDPDSCRMAARSLAELLADPALRRWSGYRGGGSVHLVDGAGSAYGPLRIVEAALPGSAELLGRDELSTRFPFRALPPGAVGIVERHAGHLSPALLRMRVLEDVVTRGAVLHRIPVRDVRTAPGVRLVDGTVRDVDVLVLATGAHTPALLATAGLPPGGLRSGRIRYGRYAVRPPGLGAFVDDTTGLYGRPDGPDTFLLGLPADRGGFDPATVQRVAAARLGIRLPPASRTVDAADCYHDPPGLALRGTVAGIGVYTFTGGSGAAAKAVFATSRVAAATLLGDLVPWPGAALPLLPVGSRQAVP